LTSNRATIASAFTTDPYLGNPPSRGRHTALTASLSLGRGDALSLTFQHRLHSACPTAPITVSINLPVLVEVSAWLPEMDSTLG
jgi:hypothetical protein